MPTIDDTDSAIAYDGGWSVDGNLHTTTSVGATATIRFTGTEINAYFTNPIGNGQIQASFTLDGKSFVMPPRHMHYVAYPEDDFFLSKRDIGTLSEGTHTLVVQNTGSEGPLNLDYFVIDGTVARQASPQPPPPATQNQGGNQGGVESRTTVITQTQIVTSAQIAPTSSTTSSTRSATSTGSSGTSDTRSSSTTSASVLSEALSIDPESGHTVTRFEVVTTSYSGVGAEITLYPAGATSKNVPVGAIIGTVIGSIAFLVFFVLFVILCLRRRQRRAAVLAQSGQDGDAGGDMRERGAAATAFTLPSRISESVRVGMSKARMQRHERTFSRLEESTEASGADYTSAPSSPPPAHSLYSYSNEKGVRMTYRPGALSDANTSTPSPMVSEGYLFSDSNSHYELPPPAYHSGRYSVGNPSNATAQA